MRGSTGPALDALAEELKAAEKKALAIRVLEKACAAYERVADRTGRECDGGESANDADAAHRKLAEWRR